MLNLEIKKLTYHTTLLLNLNGRIFPAEIKNYMIRQSLAKTPVKEWCIELIKNWREMLKKQARVDILSSQYIKDTTVIINQLIEFFSNFK